MKPFLWAASILLALAACQSATDTSQQAAKLYSQGHYSEAEAKARETLRKLRVLHSTDYRNIASALDNLAVVLKQQAKYAEAETYYEESLEIRGSHIGKSNPSYAYGLNNLGVLYRETGRNERAREVFDQAARIMRGADTQEQFALATVENNLGELDLEQGLIEQAQSRFRSSRAALAVVPRSTDTLGTLVGFETVLAANEARVERRLGNSRRAIELLRGALQTASQVLAEDHPRIASLFNDLGELEAFEGDFNTARNHYQSALVSIKSRLGDRHPDVAVVLSNLSSVYQAQGKHSEALRLV